MTVTGLPICRWEETGLKKRGNVKLRRLLQKVEEGISSRFDTWEMIEEWRKQQKIAITPVLSKEKKLTGEMYKKSYICWIERK